MRCQHVGLALLLSVGCTAEPSDDPTASAPSVDEVDVHIRRARSRATAGELEGAESDYLAAARIAGDQAGSIVGEHARLLLRHGFADRALELLTGDTASAADRSALLFVLGTECRDRGDLKTALRFWQVRAELDTAGTQPIRNVAFLRYQMADYRGAADDYRRAIDLDPTALPLRTDLAWALLQLGELDEARTLCRFVLERKPRDSAALEIIKRLEQHRPDGAKAP